jgi:Family of unknown function (DUF6535)
MLRAYLFDGMQKFRIHWVAENISLLFHVAIFLFLVGLLEFLFAANDEVTTVILWVVCALAAILARWARGGVPNPPARV